VKNQKRLQLLNLHPTQLLVQQPIFMVAISFLSCVHVCVYLCMLTDKDWFSVLHQLLPQVWSQVLERRLPTNCRLKMNRKSLKWKVCFYDYILHHKYWIGYALYPAQILMKLLIGKDCFYCKKPCLYI
jgi:hypothetical protein